MTSLAKMNRRGLLISGAAALFAPNVAIADNSRKPVIFWFYTTKEEGVRHAPVSSPSFIVSSVDIPCHGADAKPDEPAELEGWRYRIDRGQDLFGSFILACKRQLNNLIDSRGADPDLIFAGGVSRGGYAAMRLTIEDSRFKNVIGLSPVTDLMALTEFSGCKNPPAPLDADILAQRAMFLSIESRDNRVGTLSALDLVRRIVDGKRDADVELVIERGGEHTVTKKATSAAKEWVASRVGSLECREACRDAQQSR